MKIKQRNRMAIFNQLFLIKGKHADMVRDLKNKLGNECRNIDIFYISIILGLTQNQHAEINNDMKIEPAKIDPEQMIRYGDEIEFLYRLVMLSDSKYCISSQKRADKAFRYKNDGSCEKDEIHFVETMLGGLEFFYEQVAKDSAGKSDIFNNIYELVDSYNDISEEITEDSLYTIFSE